MTDRQDYNYYESPNIKDDMQNQGQKQNKKNFYSKYKEPMHKTPSPGMMDDKSSMNSMGNDYQNYPQFRKNANKKGGYNNYNNKGQNEDFDNKNYKKLKKKQHNRDMNSDYQYNTNPNQPNPIDPPQGYDQGTNPQHQKNMYNNNKAYNKNKTVMYNQNQGGTNITPPRHNTQMNIPYGYAGNPQPNEVRQPPQNQPQNVPTSSNTMQGFQGMTYPASQQNQNNSSNIKQNMQKGQNMLIHNTPNKNLMYMQQQMDNDDNNNNSNNNNQKEEKSSETTSEDNITQAQSMGASVPQNQQMGIQPSPMMDNQSQSDTMSTSSNRHSTMTTNTNPNQYMQNDMYLPKSFIQQQQYGHMPMNMYGMQNMMMMEHQNQQMFNQGVGMPPAQGMPNFPFGINEEGMKLHNKKMNKKLPSNKSPNDTPNGIVNMNPNMMGMNYPMGGPNPNQQNKGFYKPMGPNPNMPSGSLNSKGSLSMQGNKNTVPTFNNGLNLNFMMQGNPSPQGQRNNIPNMLNSNMNMPMNMNLGMGMNMNPQRQFYNPNAPTNPQGGNNNQQQNMNKRHNQNPYRTVNSDKNIIGNAIKPKDAFYQQNNQMNMNQKNNYKNQHFNNQNNNSNNQRMMHQNNRNEDWNTYPQGMPQMAQPQNMILNQGQPQMNIINPNMKQMSYGNMNDQRNNNIESLYVRIKVAKDKEELIEIKSGKDPIVLQKTLSANPNVNVNEKLLTVIYQKIIHAINIGNSILNSKLSKYNLKKLIQLKHQISKKENNEGKSVLQRSNSFDNLKEKYAKYINEIKPMYEDVKKVELLNISQYN